MFVKTFLPVMIDGHFHPRGGTFALSDAMAQYSYLDKMKKKARALGQNTDWEPPGVVAGVMTAESPQSSFGEKLRDAVARRVAQRSRTRAATTKVAATPDDDGSFSEALKRAFDARRQAYRRAN